MKVCVIEKDKNAAARVNETLRQIWCVVDVWEEADPDFSGLGEENYDAVILGSGLPGLPAGEILARMREGKCRLPVLAVTEGQAERRITLLEQGADYCLSQPFDERELVAALRAILRRSGGLIPEKLQFGKLSLDQRTFVLSGPGGDLQLGKREYEVMQMLLVNTDMVVSKELLLSKAWGDNPEAVENNVEVYISFLRKKLKSLRAEVSIETIRNLGYRLRKDVI